MILFASALGVIFGLVLLSWGAYMFFRRAPEPSFGEGSVVVNGKQFSVAVADTATKRTQGLSGVSAMGENEGMLFLFPIPAKYSFWMKDMNFPIDIIWIRDGKIAGVSENLPAPTGNGVFSLPNYTPESAVDMVLEIGAGNSKKYGFQVGHEV